MHVNITSCIMLQHKQRHSIDVGTRVLLSEKCKKVQKYILFILTLTVCLHHFSTNLWGKVASSGCNLHAAYYTIDRWSLIRVNIIPSNTPS